MPSPGTATDKDNPVSFLESGVEIMLSARYRHEMAGDGDHFIAVATAERHDDDPAIDRGMIDETGEAMAVIDDSKAK